MIIVAKDKNMHKLWLGIWIIAALSVNTVLADYKSMSEGHALFKQCMGCHGQAGERHALGKSLVLNQMTKEQIVMSIEGYLDGTYGRSMKALMKGQVSHLTKGQIENIAAYVASLNNNKLKSLAVQVTPQCEAPPHRKVDKHVPDSMKMKMKTKRYAKTLTHVKAMVIHDSKTAKEAKKRGIKQFYLTKMIFKEGKETVLELECTPYLATNNLVKFKYKSHGGEKLSLSAYNNYGKHAEKSVVFRDSLHTRALGVLDPNVKNKVMTSSNDKAIRDYFGDVELLPSDKIQLIGPDVAANGGSVPIAVRSTIKAKRVTLFAMQEQDKTKMLVQWVLHEQTLVDFAIRIKLVSHIYDGNVVSAVVEGADGKFYVSNIRVVVALGGGN